MTDGAPRAVISLVVRLLPGPASEGRVVGHAEVVATGEVVAVHQLGDLSDLVRRLSGERDALAGP